MKEGRYDKKKKKVTKKNLLYDMFKYFKNTSVAKETVTPEKAKERSSITMLDNDTKEVRETRHDINQIFPRKRLRNFDNTCFVNAVVQCWRSLDCSEKMASLKNAKITLKDAYHVPIESDPRVRMIELFPGLFPDKSDYLEDFVKMIWSVKVNDNVMFEHGLQHDATELFMLILEEMKKKYVQTDLLEVLCMTGEKFPEKANPHINHNISSVHLLTDPTHPFNIEAKQVRTCNLCKEETEVNHPTEHMYLLQFKEDGGDPISLVSLIKHSQRKGELHDFRCHKCESTDGHETWNKLKSVGKVVVFHLLRYTNNGDKIMANVQIPVELNCNEIVWGDTRNLKLKSILNHHGKTMNSGHYTATVWETDNTWVNYSDEMVKRVSVENCEFFDSNSYMVFYEVEKKAMNRVPGIYVDNDSKKMKAYYKHLMEQFNTECTHISKKYKVQLVQDYEIRVEDLSDNKRKCHDNICTGTGWTSDDDLSIKVKSQHYNNPSSEHNFLGGMEPVTELAFGVLKYGETEKAYEESSNVPVYPVLPSDPHILHVSSSSTLHSSSSSDSVQILYTQPPTLTVPSSPSSTGSSLGESKSTSSKYTSPLQEPSKPPPPTPPSQSSNHQHPLSHTAKCSDLHISCEEAHIPNTGDSNVPTERDDTVFDIDKFKVNIHLTESFWSTNNGETAYERLVRGVFHDEFVYIFGLGTPITLYPSDYAPRNINRKFSTLKSKWQGLPFVPQIHAGKEAILTRGPVEVGILMKDVTGVIESINEQGYNCIMSNRFIKTHVAIDYLSLVHNPPPFSVILIALANAKVQYISLVMAGMRWHLRGSQYVNTGSNFLKWISNVRDNAIFKRTKCKLALPMIDISWTEPPKTNVLQQWKYQRPRKDPFENISGIGGGVKGKRFPLYRSWGDEGGVTLDNTKWNETTASCGIHQIKYYSTVAHLTRSSSNVYPDPNRPIRFTNVFNLKNLIDRLDKMSDRLLIKVVKYGTSLRGEVSFFFGYNEGDVNSDLKYQHPENLFDIFYEKVYSNDIMKLWGITQVPEEDQPKLHELVRMTKMMLGTLVRETSSRNELLVNEIFYNATDTWLRAILSICMCAVGISGTELRNATKEWLNPKNCKYQYDPDCFLMLSKQNKDDGTMDYIDDYFSVKDAGLLKCCLLFSNNFDCEGLAQSLANANQRRGTIEENRKNGQLKRNLKKRFKEHCLQRMNVLTNARKMGVYNFITKSHVKRFNDSIQDKELVQGVIRKLDPTFDSSGATWLSDDKLEKAHRYSNLWVRPAFQGYATSIDTIKKHLADAKYINVDEIFQDETEVISDSDNEGNENGSDIPANGEPKVFDFRSNEWWVHLTKKILSDGMNCETRPLKDTDRSRLTYDDDDVWWYPTNTFYTCARHVLKVKISRHARQVDVVAKHIATFYNFQTENEDKLDGYGPDGKKTLDEIDGEDDASI